MAVGVNIKVLRADANVTCRQNQIRVVHTADNVHDAHVVRFKFQWIDVYLNLPIRAAERLRNRRSLYIGNLIANRELRQVL